MSERKTVTVVNERPNRWFWPGLVAIYFGHLALFYYAGQHFPIIFLSGLSFAVFWTMTSQGKIVRLTIPSHIDHEDIEVDTED